MEMRVEPVRTARDRRAFLELPWQFYRTDPAWVPPLRIELKRRIDPKTNSFFRRGTAELFLARRGREIVGRISAQIEQTEHRAPSTEHKLKEGAFGFYEAVDDSEVAQALIAAACDWLTQRGITKVIGPCNFRLEDPCPGFLTRGFEHRPMFMMTYSKPYYLTQIEQAGFTTAMDLHSYCVDQDHPLPPAFIDRAGHAAAIPGLTIRPLEMARLFDEAETIRQVMNEALKNNWGFVPFSEAHARQMARDLKLLADPRIILIAEVNRRPIGVVINLPNYYDILADCNGRLFPKGLYRMWRCRQKIHGLRGYAMGILPEYQNHGVGCLLVAESWRRGGAAGYTYGEVTWILGSNKGMNDMAEFMGGQQQKAYRLYQKEI